MQHTGIPSRSYEQGGSGRPIRLAPPLFERLGGAQILRRLLRHFYADVRQHQLLGPIFHAMVEDWSVHLDVIESFWTTVTGGPARYAGPMAARHIPLGLKEAHFEAWLGLWKHHCQMHLPKAVAGEMIGLAETVAARLRGLAMNRSLQGQEKKPPTSPPGLADAELQVIPKLSPAIDP